jgi:hypothetical protein
VRALHAVNARILGCVLNMVPAKGDETFTAFTTAAPVDEAPKIPTARSH